MADNDPVITNEKVMVLTVANKTGDSVEIELTRSDFLGGFFLPLFQNQDDSEWSWQMQESVETTERLDAYRDFLYSARDLLEVMGS